MKQDAAESVVDAIRWVRKGQLYVSEFVASQMLNRYAQGEQLGDDSAVSCLSDRELEVLNLIGSGVSTREIAARLHVSIKTVETHRAHIKSKLNLGSASQLIQFCVRWVDRSPHVVRTDATPAAIEPVEIQAPFTQPAGKRRHPANSRLQLRSRPWFVRGHAPPRPKKPAEPSPLVF